MKMHIDTNLAEKPPLVDLVDAARPVLEKAIGERADRVTATWGFRSDSHGRPVIQLTLADWSEQASEDFAPEDLQPPEQSYRRFYRLWGHLLQKASRRLSRSLETAVSES